MSAKQINESSFEGSEKTKLKALMRKLFTIKIVLLLLFITGQTIKTQAQTNPSAQALPYNQNFGTFTGSTTVYPAGIQGWGFGTTALSTTFNTAARTAYISLYPS